MRNPRLQRVCHDAVSDRREMAEPGAVDRIIEAINGLARARHEATESGLGGDEGNVQPGCRFRETLLCYPIKVIVYLPQSVPWRNIGAHDGRFGASNQNSKIF